MDGTVEPRPRGGGRSQAEPGTRGCACYLVEEDNDAILVELCDRLERRGVRISRATMGRIVQSSTHRKTLHATERDTARIQQLRVQYWQEMEQ